MLQIRLATACIWLAGLAALAADQPTPAPAPRWVSTGTLAALEANQAAAADERHIYAIDNSRIARYDRETGKRLAVSTGEAQHLNSGFLWEGRLYAAHSNYPRQPELSQLKVLDLTSMQLATYKEFGDFGGSLTWAVQHEGHWWCNFARYGSVNSETFLVKFDKDWRELARWTYPPEVLSGIGMASISGGLWRDGKLLVTDHDHRVLYEVRVPQEGRVLEFVAKHASPFPGQGIAADPLTGGLVGIDRGKKQVVFASPTLRIKVLTYNIHHGEGTDVKLDLPRIAAVIRASQADIVALQEVDKNVTRSGSVDQPAELAKLTGLEVVFGGNIPLQGGEYGNAVLSRWKVAGHKNHLLPRLDDGEQRGVLDVEIELPPPHGKLRLLATHFDHRQAEAERLQSAEAVAKLVAASTEIPTLLAGDLNATPESAPLKIVRKDFQRPHEEALPTIPVDKPARQIDFVLTGPAGRWEAVAARVLDEAVASDHRALLVEIDLLPAQLKSE